MQTAIRYTTYAWKAGNFPFHSEKIFFWDKHFLIMGQDIMRYAIILLTKIKSLERQVLLNYGVKTVT